MTLRVTTTVLLALVLIPAAAGAQSRPYLHRTDVIQTWQDFMASAVAARQCGGVQKASSRGFRANLTTISQKATRTLEQRFPTMPKAELADRMKRVSDGVREKVSAEIKQNGCKSTRIVALLQMYKTNAAMRL
jgi:hypothetical protein